ncbi:mycofactocin-coupled SDR family oxidoreductase [Rhodococcus wratislaviensis]|uniref:mycofactocin-coupled SDR family oxidoreductase n=1 Tax=Rhodococcus wratislaviensis TaxID=44752 RepID=UPI003662CFC6
MSLSGDLTGQVAFITGAARGQGRNHAVRLAEHGVDIIAVDICSDIESVPYTLATPADLKETVRLVEATGRQAYSTQVDVRDLASMEVAVREGVARFGRLDMVIANAGISSPAPTLEMSPQAWSTMIDVNLTGVWNTARAAVPAILESGRGGSVVMISSLASIVANANTAHYAAAKAGVVALMRVMASELASKKVRVNTIHPTTVATDMVLNDATYRLFRPDLEAPTREDFAVAARTLNKMRITALDVDDITATVLHLVGESGRYITGQTLVVDAGGSL